MKTTTSHRMNQAATEPALAPSFWAWLKAALREWLMPDQRPSWIPRWVWALMRALWGAGWSCLAALWRLVTAILAVWNWPARVAKAWAWLWGAWGAWGGRASRQSSGDSARWQWLRWGRRLRVSPEQS